MAALNDAASDSPQPAQFERAIPFRESKAPLGPFRATKIWKDIIEHLKNRVELKRRRYKLRYIETCFTGSDAVDVVLHFLLSDKDTFSTDLSREKAAKVCQMLIHRKVFKSATDKPGACATPPPFEDSASKLYMFLGEHAPAEANKGEDTEKAKGDVENNKPGRTHAGLDLTPRPDTLRLSGYRFEPDDEPCEGPGDVPTNHNLEPLRRIHFNSGKSTTKSKSLTSDGSSSLSAGDFLGVSFISNDIVEETWKQVALTQLLSLVELTFLDGILCDDDKHTEEQQQRQNLIISNLVAKNWNLPIASSDLSSSADPLLQTAMECIEFLPKGLNLLSEPIFKRKNYESKLWAKGIIVKHYASLPECLLPRRFLELNLAILNLILQDSMETVLSAFQLYMILLPVPTREELGRLLNFMHSLISDKTLTLDAQKSNEMVVLSTFTNSIFKHKLLAPNLAQKLVQVMVMNVDRIFTVPRAVREKVAMKLHSIKTGKPVLGADSTFCNLISVEEYERQSKNCTESSLVDLINSVLDNTSISLKEKKHRLKQFQKSYPVLYEKHFNGLL